MRALNRSDDVIPVLGRWPLPCTTAPTCVRRSGSQKHGHVATNAITLRRNTGDRFYHCLAKTRLKRVNLQNIWRCRKVRILTAGADPSFPQCRNAGSFLASSAFPPTKHSGCSVTHG
jgi:hypothetical protein